MDLVSGGSSDEGEPGYWSWRRSKLELRATVLFAAAAITISLVCGSVIVSGWFAGVMVDNWERVFWAGALIAGLSIAAFAAAAFPGGNNARRDCTRITWSLRIGLTLFVAAPFLCLLSLAGNFFLF